MAKQPANNGDSEAFLASERAYFDLLRRELEARGQGPAAAHLRTHLKLRPESELSLGRNTMVRAKVTQRVTDYRLRLNANNGETLGWYVDLLAKGGDKSLAPEEAVKIAEKAAQPSEEAELELSEYDDTSGRTVFRARWRHEHKSMPVEGDFIEVLVNGKARRAFSMARRWHKPDMTGKITPR